ncbi:MAG: hypothetical protein CL844_00765 [Crocinitomicaceae bacterium]|nr:hypothetical protein [Crocinitomicaceae bacterium]|tara:strand:- start:24382 stop:25800 length:1419 start_codon:yes stop_codon:yes gene_type:complete
MFDDEENVFDDQNLRDELFRFNAFINGEPFGFLDSDRWELLIDHFLLLGKFDEAILCIQEALSQFSHNDLFRLKLAQCLSAKGKLKESIDLLSDIEKVGFSSFELFQTKAYIYSQLKESNKAISYYIKALDSASDIEKDDVFLDLAIEYQNTGNYNLSIKVLKEAIRLNSNNESAICEIASCYDSLGDFDNAIKTYSDFIDENPYSYVTWYNLGNAYSKIEDFDNAIKAYDYSILIKEDFGPVYFNLANAYLAIEDYGKAIECFHKNIEIDGEDSLALCYIGECHEQLDELELAKIFYKRSLELEPLLPDAWLGLGIIEDIEGNTNIGLDLIKKASDLDPENPFIQHILAGAYEKIEQFKNADSTYQIALALDPNNEDCLINYVKLLKKESDQNALDYLNVYDTLKHDNKILSVLKVSVNWDLGNKEKAIKLFKECFEMNKFKALKLFEINPKLKTIKEFTKIVSKLDKEIK